MDSLTLHVDGLYLSPYALSAFVALEEKQLPYTLVTVQLDRGEQREPGFAQRSLTGRVPMLVHGDYALTESQAIGEYLAETFPHPGHPRLFPADLRERGRARQLMAWIRSDLGPIREERSTHTMFYARAGRPLSEAGEAARARVVAAADALLTGDRPTLFASWCLADTDFGFFLMRLVLNGDPVPAKVRAYAEAQWQRPSVQKWMALPRPAHAPW